MTIQVLMQRQAQLILYRVLNLGPKRTSFWRELVTATQALSCIGMNEHLHLSSTQDTAMTTDQKCQQGRTAMATTSDVNHLHIGGWCRSLPIHDTATHD